MACLARLTSWERTGEAIGKSKMRASVVKLCKNIPSEGVLCQECSARPRDGKYQSRMLHGLLSEPIPAASHIYGGEWYWERVAAYGPPPTAWIEMAEEAQRAGEERCAGAGTASAAGVPSAAKVQRLDEKDMQRLVMAKKEKDSKAAIHRLRKSASAPVVTSIPTKGTLLTTFAPITKMYVESAKPVAKMPTDSCGMWKELWEDTNVWITKNGMVFDVDVRGEPDELIGRYSNGIFTPIE